MKNPYIFTEENNLGALECCLDYSIDDLKWHDGVIFTGNKIIDLIDGVEFVYISKTMAKINRYKNFAIAFTKANYTTDLIKKLCLSMDNGYATRYNPPLCINHKRIGGVRELGENIIFSEKDAVIIYYIGRDIDKVNILTKNDELIALLMLYSNLN